MFRHLPAPEARAATAMEASRPDAAEFMRPEIAAATPELADILTPEIMPHFPLVADLAARPVDGKMVWRPFASLTCALPRLGIRLPAGA